MKDAFGTMPQSTEQSSRHSVAVPSKGGACRIHGRWQARRHSSDASGRVMRDEEGDDEDNDEDDAEDDAEDDVEDNEEEEEDGDVRNRDERQRGGGGRGEGRRRGDDSFMLTGRGGCCATRRTMTKRTKRRKRRSRRRRRRMGTYGTEMTG